MRCVLVAPVEEATGLAVFGSFVCNLVGFLHPSQEFLPCTFVCSDVTLTVHIETNATILFLHNRARFTVTDRDVHFTSLNARYNDHEAICSRRCVVKNRFHEFSAHGFCFHCSQHASLSFGNVQLRGIFFKRFSSLLFLWVLRVYRLPHKNTITYVYFCKVIELVNSLPKCNRFLL